MSVSSFDVCRTIESKSLEILRPYIHQTSYNGQYVINEKGRLAKEIQCVYGDLFINHKNGKLYSVEIKAEEENKYGNLFIETWSNRETRKPGWIVTLNADILLYHFIKDDIAYVMDFQELWRFLYMHNNGSRPIIYQYPQKLQSKYEQKNDTWGACVPIADLSKGLKTFTTIKASTGEKLLPTPLPLFANLGA